MRRGEKRAVIAVARTILQAAWYGARATPGEERELVSAFRRGEAVEGPAIAEFEERFAAYHGLML